MKYPLVRERSSTYTILRSVTTLTTNHTGLSVNSVFNYRVRAYRMAGATRVYSGYSDVKSIATPPSAPVIKAVSKSIETISLSWTKVVNATGYVVYVNGVEHSVINDGNTLSTDISGLNLGESYDFSLVAKNGELSSGFSAIVKATPIPGSVTNFKVSDANFNRLSLSWDSVEGADHYDVYQGTSPTVVNTKVGSVTETSFNTSIALNYNTTYYYKVIPVTVNGVTGVVSPVINGKTMIKNPEDLSVSSPNATSADLSWSAVEGAAGYEISFSKGTSSTYTILRSVTTLTTNHTGLSVNSVFNYRVRAYRMAGATRVYSGYSDVKSIATPPSAPVIKAVSKSIETISLSWTKVVNATGYVVYVNGVEHSVINDGNTLSTDISGLNLGESYDFSLVAKNGELSSGFSAIVKATPIPGSVTNFKVSDANFNRLSLSWDSVEGADHYDVYQGTSPTVVNTKVGSVTETSFNTSIALNYNTTYYYKVIPVTVNGVTGVVSPVINGKTSDKESRGLECKQSKCDECRFKLVSRRRRSGL
jgi:fibronectin type 3 domain-containing protein/alkylated DNA nucleotide flippase Atl1